jgi:hypothetical protein
VYFVRLIEILNCWVSLQNKYIVFTNYSIHYLFSNKNDILTRMQFSICHLRVRFEKKLLVIPYPSTVVEIEDNLLFDLSDLLSMRLQPKYATQDHRLL